MKYLLISGSPRKGNINYILDNIFESLQGDKDLILLKDKKIGHCIGCLSCDKTKKCVISDDMQEIYGKLKEADVLIIGTPNYYDNVSGLLKDFMDRTNPFYQTGILKGKKVFYIVVGGGNTDDSKSVAETVLKDFADAHEMEVISNYIFQALGARELLENEKASEEIKKITSEINLLK